MWVADGGGREMQGDGGLRKWGKCRWDAGTREE